MLVFIFFMFYFIDIFDINQANCKLFLFLILLYKNNHLNLCKKNQTCLVLYIFLISSKKYTEIHTKNSPYQNKLIQGIFYVIAMLTEKLSIVASNNRID